MNWRFLGAQDFWCGALLVAIAAFFLTAGSELAVGTSLRMGPGYMPRLLSVMIGLAGAAICIRGLLANAPRLKAESLRPLALVLGAMLFFAFALQRIGLVLTIVCVVAIASAAIREARAKEVVVVASVMAVLCSALFVYGLRLVIPLWPTY
jgi:Tripartite tricarboxylate transporter TctB family